MVAGPVRFVMLMQTLLPVVSVCVIPPAVVDALQARPVTPITTRTPAVSAAAIQVAEEAALRVWNAIAIRTLQGVVSVHRLSVAVVRRDLFVTRQPGFVCATVLAAGAAQPEPRVILMLLRKAAVSACAILRAAEIAQRERYATRVQAQILVGYVLSTQLAV